MNHIAFSYHFRSSKHCVKKRPVSGEFIALYMDNDNTQHHLFQILLMFEFTVDRDENIERGLRKGEERSVLTAPQPDLRYRFDFVTGKSSFDSGVHALI